MTADLIFISLLYFTIWITSMTLIKGFINNSAEPYEKAYSIVVVLISILLILVYSKDLT